MHATPTAPPTPATGYVVKSELAAAVAHFQATGRTTQTLRAALDLIAGGVWDRYRFTDDRDTFVDQAVDHLRRHALKTADPAQNCFGYLSRSVIQFGHTLRRLETPPARQEAAIPSVGYVDKKHLSRLVAAYHADGRASDDLGKVLAQIAGGVWDRFRYTDSRDDFVGDVLVHFLSGPLRKADPAQNCFGFLTTCAVRYGGKLRDRAQTERKKSAAYRQARTDAHRIYPPTEGDS